jgi:hypothetical protein
VSLSGVVEPRLRHESKTVNWQQALRSAHSAEGKVEPAVRPSPSRAQRCMVHVNQLSITNKEYYRSEQNRRLFMDARWDFFVSYAQPDRQWADWTVHLLREAGYRVFFARDIGVGESWIQQVGDALERSSKMILLLSAAYLEPDRTSTAMEWQAFMAKNHHSADRNIVPIRIEQCDVTGLLSRFAWLDLFGLDEETARKRLLLAVGSGPSFSDVDAKFPTHASPSAGAVADGTSKTYDRRRRTPSPLFPQSSPPSPKRSQRTYNHLQASPHSDSPTTDDRLGMAADVRRMAAIAAATSTSPPLSIALLGDWGTGKSSFMLQMQHAIDHDIVGRMGYVRSAKQVRYNAWHYSDRDVWTGLIEQLFRSLSEDLELPGKGAPDSDAQLAQRLRITSEIDAVRRMQDALTQDIHKIADTTTNPPWSVEAPARLVRIALAVGRQALIDIWAKRRTLLLTAVVLLGLAVGALVTSRLLSSPIPSRLASAILAIGAVVAFIRPGLMVYRAVAAYLHTKSGGLEDQLRALRARASELSEQLALVDATHALAVYVERAASSGLPGAPRGVVGEVRQRLEELTAALDKAHTVWMTQGGRPPLERIVLYVDDLDRCSAKTVVDTLAAVHLLLSTPLFVVVLAVDIQWLVTALERETLRKNESTTQSDRPPTHGALSYLDKLIQLPFAVPRMNHMAATYVQTLMPNVEGVPGVKEASDQGAPATRVGDASHRLIEEDPVSDSAQASPPSLLSLTVTQDEHDFVRHVVPLLETPRAAKKLVNLYRLVRVGVDFDEIEDFVGNRESGGPYQAVILLLAALVGRPLGATALLADLASSSSDLDLIEWLREREADPESSASERALCADLATLVDHARHEISVTSDLRVYREWALDVSRFSLYGGPTWIA